MLSPPFILNSPTKFICPIPHCVNLHKNKIEQTELKKKRLKIAQQYIDYKKNYILVLCSIDTCMCTVKKKDYIL